MQSIKFNLKPTITSAVLLAGTFASAGASAALIPLNNLNFETGTLAGWTTIGSVLASSSTSVTTFDGTVWSIGAAGTTMAQLQSSGASVGAIETALGLAGGTLNTFNTNPNGGNLTNGSAMYQSFSGNVGDTLSFAWNYVATDYIPFNDPAFALLIGPSNQIEVLASIQGLGAAVGTSGNSGWQTFNAALASSGNYTLGIVTTNDKDTILNSVLHIDGTAGSCSPTCPPVGVPVPEPTSLAMLGLGLLGLGASRIRREKLS